MGSRKEGEVDALKPVPSDDELMTTFWPAERDHWRECEVEAETRAQMEENWEMAQRDGVVGVKPVYGGVRNGNGPADFNMSMFARFCLILRDDYQARLANPGTVQPLTKEQQQNLVSGGTSERRLLSALEMRAWRPTGICEWLRLAILIPLLLQIPPCLWETEENLVRYA